MRVFPFMPEKSISAAIPFRKRAPNFAAQRNIASEYFAPTAFLKAKTDPHSIAVIGNLPRCQCRLESDLSLRWSKWNSQMQGSCNRSVLTAGLLLSLLIPCVGCSTLSFRVKGTPAQCLPIDCLVYPKRNLVPIDVSKLAQPSPDAYRVDSGDVLGIAVEGIIPFQDPDQVPQLPPVHFRGMNSEQPPALGFPVLVQESGNIALPSIGMIQVAGATLQEVSDKITEACLKANLRKQREVLTAVTLINPRTYNITVIREDVGGNPQEHQANGKVVQLAAYRNDVLNALMATGGLPGLLAKNEIRIRRRQPNFNPPMTVLSRSEFEEPADPDDGDISKPDNATSVADRPDPSANNQTESITAENANSNASAGLSNEVANMPIMMAERVIPLRVPCNLEYEIRPEEIILQDGDIIIIENRTTEVFYTGGLLPGGEFALPRDYDIDIFEAMAIAGYSFGSPGAGAGGGMGGIGGMASLSGVFPTRLYIMRKRSNGTQYTIEVDLKEAVENESERLLVAPGDKLMLRYKPREELVNFGSFAFFTFGIRELFR